MVEVEHGPLCLSENWKLHLTLSAPPPAVGFIFRYSRTNTASNTIHQIVRTIFISKNWNIQFCMLPCYFPCFTCFITVFVFALQIQPFLHIWVLLVSELKFYIVTTTGTSHQNLICWFDWGVLLTQGQHVWAAFCMIFSGVPHSTIFGLPKYAHQIRPNGRIWRI